MLCVRGSPYAVSSAGRASLIETRSQSKNDGVPDDFDALVGVLIKAVTVLELANRRITAYVGLPLAIGSKRPLTSYIFNGTHP